MPSEYLFSCSGIASAQVYKNYTKAVTACSLFVAWPEKEDHFGDKCHIGIEESNCEIVCEIHFPSIYIAEKRNDALQMQNCWGLTTFGCKTVNKVPSWKTVYSCLNASWVCPSELKAQIYGQIPLLTVQKKACVWTPKFVDGDTSVVAIISIRNIKKRQLWQWSSIRNFQVIKVIEDPWGKRVHTWAWSESNAGTIIII